MAEDPLPLICAGSIALILVAAAVILILGRRPFTIQKRRQGDSTLITLSAKRNLNRVIVLARFDGEEVSLERKRVRKGQSVDFSFPYSEKKTRITVEEESGSQRSVEV